MKHYLQAKHEGKYTEDMLRKLSRRAGAGASGGLVAAILACFEKANIVSGMDFVN